MIQIEKVHSKIALDELFMQEGFKRKYSSNEMIFMQNDREHSLYYIASGLVKLSMISDDGKEKTLFILSPGHFFGEVSFSDQLEYPVNAETLTATVIYSINHQQVTDILRQNPDLALELLQVMANKMRLITQQIKDLVFYDIDGRMASQLLSFAEQFGVSVEEGLLIDLVLTHQELANQLGASRVTVTKTLNFFKKNGMIDIVNRQILIRDLQKLKEYIC